MRRWRVTEDKLPCCMVRNKCGEDEAVIYLDLKIQGSYMVSKFKFKHFSSIFKMHF